MTDLDTTTATFALHGEVDVSNAGDIRNAATRAVRAGHDVLVLDCERVTFMDSQGVNALVAAHVELEVVVRLPSPPVRRVLAITGLDGVLHLA